MKQVILLFGLLLITLGPCAQVGVNSSGESPDPSAMLDVKSSSSGLLMPRMTTAERDAILSPAEGLQIFNTTTKCFEAFVYGNWYIVSCPVPCIPPDAPQFSSFTPNPCGPSGVYTQINQVSGATYYLWTVPDGVSITSGQGTTDVTMDFPAGPSVHNICVRVLGACGTSAETCGTVEIPDPSNPPAGPITGASVVCQGDSEYTYSIPPPAGAAGYNWTIPSGAYLTSGQNAPSITVRFTEDAVSGPIDVTVYTNCGSISTEAPLNVTVRAVPSALAASNVGGDSFTANWNSSSGAVGYVLDVFTQSGNNEVFVPGYEGLSVGNVTQYDVTGLDPEVLYAYRVTAVFADCNAASLPAYVCVGCSQPALGTEAGNPGTSCLAIKNAVPTAPDGVYWIDPNGGPTGDAFRAYCDMTTDGGGWTYVARGASVTTTALGSVSLNPNQEVTWHMAQNTVRQLYSNSQTYQIYTWSNTYDGQRIRIFRPLTDYSLTMNLGEVWNGSAFVSGGGQSMGYFNSGPHCVLRTDIGNMINAQSNMHWSYGGGTNYMRCVQEAHGPNNGLLFIR